MNLTYRTGKGGSINKDNVLSEKNCTVFKHRFSKVMVWKIFIVFKFIFPERVYVWQRGQHHISGLCVRLSTSTLDHNLIFSASKTRSSTVLHHIFNVNMTFPSCICLVSLVSCQLNVYFMFIFVYFRKVDQSIVENWFSIFSE